MVLYICENLIQKMITMHKPILLIAFIFSFISCKNENATSAKNEALKTEIQLFLDDYTNLLHMTAQTTCPDNSTSPVLPYMM